MDAAGSRGRQRPVNWARGPSEGTCDRTAAPAYANFGTLLRFWRNTFRFSQEVLAERAGISPRHVSFLENDRTSVGKDVAHRLADALALGPQERTSFLLAAGYAPDGQEGISYPADGTALKLMLRNADPLPAMVMGRDGRIRAVNKAWLLVHRRYLGELADLPDLNAIMLFVHPRGWRRFVEGWEDIASVYLMMLQQHALLERSAEAGRLLRALIAVPGVPGDWARRGAALSGRRADYSLAIGVRPGACRLIRIVHNMVGTFPLAAASDLVIQYAFPEDGEELLTGADRQAIAGIRHPLCPYD